MANALSSAAAGLAATLKSVAGESVVYTRGPLSSDPLTAVADVQTYEVLDQQALEMFRTAKRYVPLPAELAGREFELELRAIYSLRDQPSG